MRGSETDSGMRVADSGVLGDRTATAEGSPVETRAERLARIAHSVRAGKYRVGTEQLADTLAKSMLTRGTRGPERTKRSLHDV